jgi:hypothetical protein
MQRQCRVTLCEPDSDKACWHEQGRVAAAWCRFSRPKTGAINSMCKPRYLTTTERQRQTSTTHLYGFISKTPPTLPTAMNDLKQLSMDSEKGEAMLSRPSRPSRSRNRPLVTGFTVVAVCYLLWSATSRFNIFHHLCGKHGVTPVTINHGERTLVPLEAHIMSKCPDAKVASTSTL